MNVSYGRLNTVSFSNPAYSQGNEGHGIKWVWVKHKFISLFYQFFVLVCQSLTLNKIEATGEGGTK